MDCEAASERLPWLLTGSLEQGEADQVRGHLTGCPLCRAEMEETRRAASVFGAHLPTAVILDLAWDRAVQGLDPALVRAHLDGCAECQEELALARESRQLESTSAEAPLRRRTVAWPVFALPATLAAGLVIGVWWSDREPPAGPSVSGREQDRLRVSTLETEVARLRGVVSALEAAAKQVRLPQLNLPLFEVLPGSLVRGAEGQGNEVMVPAGATQVALLLSADAPTGTPATLVIERRGGGEVWRGGGLVYGPPGGYVVALPAELLDVGDYALTVRPDRGAATVYRIHVRRPR